MSDLSAGQPTIAQRCGSNVEWRAQRRLPAQSRAQIPQLPAFAEPASIATDGLEQQQSVSRTFCVGRCRCKITDPLSFRILEGCVSKGVSCVEADRQSGEHCAECVGRTVP